MDTKVRKQITTHKMHPAQSANALEYICNIMAEGFCFMPLGLVRLRTFQCMGYLGATFTQVFTRAGGADVSLRDVTIAQMGNGARECR